MKIDMKILWKFLEKVIGKNIHIQNMRTEVPLSFVRTDVCKFGTNVNCPALI